MNLPSAIRVGGISFLILFTELALIRFLPAHVLYFGFFTNFILIAAFLGIGIGFLLATHKRSMVGYFPIVLALIICLTKLAQTTIQIDASDVIFFADEFYSARSPIPAHVVLPLACMIVALACAMLSQELGKLFIQIKQPLDTYLWDIVGSIVGLICFSVISFIGAPPPVWFAVIAVVFLTVIPLPKLNRATAILAFAVTLIVGIDHGPGTVFWSPYYRLHLIQNKRINSGYLFANNIGHQSYTRIKNAVRYPLMFAQIFPYAPPNNALVIGAGTGQDVAALLYIGAGHVDAVEIDPTIAAIGKRFHPEKPYASGRVTLIVDDGRNVLKNTTKRYDVIIFALTDSLILSSGLGDVRLESYLFTKEAFMAAREKLTSDGSFVLYNNYRTQWLIDRIGMLLTDVFSTPPRQMYLGPTARMFLASKTPRTTDSTSLLTPFQPQEPPMALPTDDWPFLYVRNRSIPLIYVVTLAALGVIALVVVASVLAIQKQSVPLTKPVVARLFAFFFSGAAFSLIETKSLVQLALLFGATWFVNSLAFVGILVSVLLAIIVTKRFRTPTSWIIPLLLVSLIIQYAIPVSWLVTSSPITRFVLSLPYFFLPIFLANVFFSRLFKQSTTPDLDMGSNILGLVAGGVAEYIALITGYQALALVALGLYILTWCAAHRALQR